MSQICINVKFLPGSGFVDAITEASDLAIRLNAAYIIFNFNGTKISVQPGCSEKSIAVAWEEYLDGVKHIIVKRDR